jgi:hypothetical protein
MASGFGWQSSSGPANPARSASRLARAWVSQNQSSFVLRGAAGRARGPGRMPPSSTAPAPAKDSSLARAEPHAPRAARRRRAGGCAMRIGRRRTCARKRRRRRRARSRCREAHISARVRERRCAGVCELQHAALAATAKLATRTKREFGRQLRGADGWPEDDSDSSIPPGPARSTPGSGHVAGRGRQGLREGGEGPAHLPLPPES